MDCRERLLVRREQREALLDAFKSSGLSAMAFCQLHDLKYSTFATWRQKKRSSSHSNPIRIHFTLRRGDRGLEP